MKRLACIVALAALPALAADSAEGELVANGDKVSLNAVTVEAGLGEVGLLITDEPLPPACGVFDAFVLAGEGKVRGIAITISRETQQKESAGINALFHESWEGQLGTIGEPEIEIELFNQEALKGSVRLAEGSLNDHKFSYSVAFDVSLGGSRPPIEATVTDATDSEPAKSYAEFYGAMMAGRFDDGKKLVTKENAEMMTDEDAAFFLELFQDSHPREATVSSVDEAGDSATLKVEGVVPACMSSDKATGTVDMVKEDGAWKVKLESWEM